MPISLPKIKIKNPLGDVSPEDQKVFLICLCIAFFFWILVKLSKDYTVHRQVYINYELPLGVNFTTSPPNELEVDLRAKGWYFFQNAILKRTLSLRYQVPIGTAFELSANDLQVDIDRLLKDKNVFISYLYSEGFRVLLEKQAVRRLPIVVPHKIGFAPEYALAETVSIQPDSVRISGAASRLESLTEWPTDSLILNEVDQDYTATLRLSPPQEGLKYIPETVVVSVKVERLTEKNIFLPIQTDYLTDSIRFFPDKVLLKCVVGLGYYNELDAEGFILRAVLNDTLISEGKSTVALELIQQPDYVRSVQLSPRVVEFFIIKK